MDRADLMSPAAVGVLSVEIGTDPTIATVELDSPVIVTAPPTTWRIGTRSVTAATVADQTLTLTLDGPAIPGDTWHTTQLDPGIRTPSGGYVEGNGGIIGANFELGFAAEPHQDLTLYGYAAGTPLTAAPYLAGRAMLCNRTGTLKLINTNGNLNSTPAAIDVHGIAIVAMAYDTVGAKLICASESGFIDRYTVGSAPPVDGVTISGPDPYGMAFDGTYLYVWSQIASEILIYDYAAMPWGAGSPGATPIRVIPMQVPFATDPEPGAGFAPFAGGWLFGNQNQTGNMIWATQDFSTVYNLPVSNLSTKTWGVVTLTGGATWALGTSNGDPCFRNIITQF